MKQYIFVLMSAIVLSFFHATPAYAVSKVSDASAMRVKSVTASQPDERGDKLKSYLRSHDSPLAESADVFVEQADRNGLDWKLVAAIAGTESTFGKHIPSGSYNCWGWGIPTGAQRGIAFSNFENGVATVSEGLKTNYINKGAVSIEQIGAIYAASPRWSGNVRFFMDQIDAFVPNDPQLLDITI